MRSCLIRLLLLSIVLVFAAAFYNMGICERAYAAKADDGTTSGSGLDNYSRDTTDKAGSGKPWNSLYVSRQRESFRVEPDEMGSYR